MALYQYQRHIIVLAAFCAIAPCLSSGCSYSGRDTAGRKRALRTSEERYLLALAGSTDGLWDWDLLSDTVFYSDRFREILGYSSEEFPGTIDSFRSRLHPEDAEAIWAAIERHLQERVPYKVEYRLQNKIRRVPVVSRARPGHLEQRGQSDPDVRFYSGHYRAQAGRA